MTALQLLILNGSLASIFAVLAYLMTHGDKNTKKDKSIKH